MRTLFLSLSIIGLVAGACGTNENVSDLNASSAEVDADAPYPFTISRQRLDHRVIQEYIDRGLANYKTNERTVQHLRLEVYENNKAATAAQITLFGLATATYQDTIDQFGIDTELATYDLHYVKLDASGKPEGKEAWRVSFRRDGNQWKKSIRADGTTKSFMAALPEWAKPQLQQLSGFLSLNSGMQIVPFFKTENEQVVSFLGEVLDFAPGVAKKAIGSVVENAVKKFAKAEMEKLVASNELRFGGGFEIKNDKALEFTDIYLTAGAKIWAR